MSDGTVYAIDGKEILATIEFPDFTLVGDVSVTREVGIPSWILMHPDLSDRAVRLWGLLRGALNGSVAVGGTSGADLAELLKCSERTARDSVYQLRDSGALGVQAAFKDGRQGRNVYYLWPMSAASSSSQKPENFGVAASCQGGSQLPPVLINQLSNNLSTNGEDGSKATKRRRKRIVYSESFEDVWEIYPNRVAKADASRAYELTLAEPDVSESDLLASVFQYADSVRGKEKQFILHASTFFGPGERWRDYLEVAQEAKIKPLSGLELIKAMAYDAYDADGVWIDESGMECCESPLMHGLSRPTNSSGDLVDSGGNPYSLDAQGVRRRADFWKAS